MLYIKKQSPPALVAGEVRKIQRSPEWRRLKGTDTRAVRAYFDLLPKEVLRQALSKEQNGLFAYCMKRIPGGQSDTRIEHWYPLSLSKEGALDFKNMLGVCYGGEKSDHTKSCVLCCDAQKGEQEIYVDPLSDEQMEKISYHRDGTIYTSPFNAKMDDDINGILHLNGILDKTTGKRLSDTNTEIVKGRRDTYERCSRQFERMAAKKSLTSSNLKGMIEEIENAARRGKELPEFIGVTLYRYKKKYQWLLKHGR